MPRALGPSRRATPFHQFRPKHLPGLKELAVPAKAKRAKVKNSIEESTPRPLRPYRAENLHSIFSLLLSIIPTPMLTFYPMSRRGRTLRGLGGEAPPKIVDFVLSISEMLAPKDLMLTQINITKFTSISSS